MTGIRPNYLKTARVTTMNGHHCTAWTPFYLNLYATLSLFGEDNAMHEAFNKTLRANYIAAHRLREAGSGFTQVIA